MAIKKRQFRKRRVTGRKLTKVMKKEVKQIIAVKQELKYFAPLIGGTAITSTAIQTLMNTISQGDNDSQRNGDKVMMSPGFWVTYNITPGDQFNFVRVLIFQWKPVSGTSSYIPTIADIVLNGSSSFPDFTSQYNHDKRTQYRILYDKVSRVVGNGSSALINAPFTDLSTVFIKTYVKIPFRQVQYQAGTNDNLTNGIYLVLISDSAIASIVHPNLSMTYKMTYTDS